MCALASEPVLASRRPATLYLYAARAARGVGDGFAFIILPAYLSELGFDPLQIGVVATAALLGSAATTLAVGFLAARYDLRSLLLIGAVVMAATGLAVAHSQALALILVIVFIGSLNPSTGDIGMIVPLEHAMLARGAQDQERTRVFARYSLIGTASTAAGALAWAAALARSWAVLARAWDWGLVGAFSPAGLSPAGLSPAGLSPAGLSPAGFSAAAG